MEKAFRKHTCRNNHSWRALVKFSKSTQRLSGEQKEYCPDCELPASFSEPWETADGTPYFDKIRELDMAEAAAEREMNTKRINALYNVLLSYAEGERAIKICQEFVNESETNQSEILLELAVAVKEGIANGHWPWYD